MAFLVALHFWRVRKDGGLSAPPDRLRRRVHSWPHLVFRELLVLVLVLVVVHAAALLFDAPLEEIADATRTPNPAKAPWYFLGLQELVHYGAIFGGVVVPTALVLALLVAPLRRHAPARRGGVVRARAARRERGLRGDRRRPGGGDDRRDVLPRPELGLGVAVVKPRGLGRRVSPGLLLAFGLLSLALVGTVVWAVWKEARAEWRVHQARYARSRRGRRRSAPRTRLRGVQQMWIPDLDRVDRCTSCHLGIAEPERRDAPQPFRAHPGRWLETHRPDRYGCTSCHGGQGEATTHRGAAHEPIPYWPEPMASRELMEARCGTCHQERRPRGTDWLARGRALMADRNCAACHEVPGHDAAEVRSPRLDGLPLKVSPGVAAGLAREAEELPAEVADGGLPPLGEGRRGAHGVPAAAARDAAPRPGRLVEGRRGEGRGGLPRLALRHLPRGERARGNARPRADPRRGEGVARVALLLDPRPAPLPAEDAHAAVPLHGRAGARPRGLPLRGVRRAARGLRRERRAAFRGARGRGARRSSRSGAATPATSSRASRRSRGSGRSSPRSATGSSSPPRSWRAASSRRCRTGSSPR